MNAVFPIGNLAQEEEQLVGTAAAAAAAAGQARAHDGLDAQACRRVREEFVIDITFERLDLRRLRVIDRRAVHCAHVVIAGGHGHEHASGNAASRVEYEMLHIENAVVEADEVRVLVHFLPVYSLTRGAAVV